MKPGLVAAALLALAALACRGEGQAPVAPDAPPEGSTAKPSLALLTSLPLAFAEGLTLEAPAHPAMTALEGQFDVRLIDGPAQLPARGLLLAAQPRALTAERLVELDRWVREGGRMVLLADPMLEWESERPLGDTLRLPPAFQDTGLLQHWGLTLFAPAERGPRIGRIGDQEVLTSSPGSLTVAAGQCRVEEGSLVARCRLGRGQVMVVADADFLHLAGEGALDGPTGRNLPALMDLLQRLR